MIMMREKYESLPLKELREIAKTRGIKSISAMRKSELIDRMCLEDEKEKAAEEENIKEEKKGQEENKGIEKKAAEKTDERRQGRRK